MSDNLDQLRDELLSGVEGATSLDALEAIRIDALGKKGRITAEMKNLGALDPEARKAAGQALNQLKGAVAEAINMRKGALEDDALNAKLAEETIDVSLPPAAPWNRRRRGIVPWGVSAYFPATARLTVERWTPISSATCHASLT